MVAKLYFSVGNVVEAEYHHNIAYDLKMKAFGLYNFETIDSINERGRIMLSKKNEKDAMEYFT